MPHNSVLMSGTPAKTVILTVTRREIAIMPLQVGVPAEVTLNGSPTHPFFK